jgi:hypothetical protein
LFALRNSWASLLTRVSSPLPWAIASSCGEGGSQLNTLASSRQNKFGPSQHNKLPSPSKKCCDSYGIPVVPIRSIPSTEKKKNAIITLLTRVVKVMGTLSFIPSTLRYTTALHQGKFTITENKVLVMKKRRPLFQLRIG